MIDEGSFCTGCHLSHKTPQHSHRLPPCSYSLKTITISEFGAHIDKLLKLRNKKLQFGCFWANPFTFTCIYISFGNNIYFFLSKRFYYLESHHGVCHSMSHLNSYQKPQKPGDFHNFPSFCGQRSVFLSHFRFYCFSGENASDNSFA